MDQFPPISSSFILLPSSFQPKHVLHVVETGGLAMCPEGGAERPAGEGFAARGFVREFDAFALRGVDDGVIADDIAAADGVDADLRIRARTDNSVPAMLGVVIVFQLADLRENLDEPFGRSAG